MLDREINKGVSLEKTIAEIWTDIQDPILVKQGPTPVWIRFLCREMKGDFLLEKSKIICFTGIKVKNDGYDGHHKSGQTRSPSGF